MTVSFAVLREKPPTGPDSALDWFNGSFRAWLERNALLRMEFFGTADPLEGAISSRAVREFPVFGGTYRTV